MKKTILLLPLILLLLGSCKKDDETDNQQPTFESVTVNGTEMLTVDENIVKNGDALTFKITVKDNIELSELSVEVHEAGDGHEHERVKKAGEALAFGPKIYDVSGTSEQTIEVKVSDKLDNEVTDYHLNLTLLDKESNRSTTIQTFEIQ